MQDITARAQAIFQLTALSENDVIPETAAVVIAHELEGVAGLFSGLLEDGFIDAQSIGYFEKVVIAAQHFRTLLLQDARQIVEVQNGAAPLHIVAADLCLEVVEILKELELQPEWRQHYDEQARRLKFFALILKENPDNEIRSV